MLDVIRRYGFVNSTIVKPRIGFSRLLLLIALFCFGVSQADPAPLTQDTYVNGGPGQANKNNGTKAVIIVETSKPQQGLMQFDLTALGGTVLSATLTLNVTAAGIPGNVDVHRVQAAWNELVVMYNTRPPVDAASSGTIPIAAGDVGGTVVLDITALAQGWVTSPASNFGLALLPNGVVDVRFATQDVSLGATLDVTTDGGAPPPPPPPAGSEVSVSHVIVDLVSNLLFIDGANFDNGATPIVTVGDLPVLMQPIPHMATMIQANLPPGILDGDYLLTVTTGPADGQTATYDLTIDAELTEAEVDAFVSNNGFSTGPHYTDAEAIAAIGPHTVDTDTTRSDAEILSVVGPHTVDTDTTRSDAEILSVVGPHTNDTNTQLDEAQVDAFVANNGFSTGPHTLVSSGTNTSGGTNALGSNTSGSSNTAIGNNALSANTTGGNNTALGASALNSVTNLGFNTAVGSRALRDSTGPFNTALGAWALQVNTSGSDNTAAGQQSLTNNAAGSSNTALGSRALRDNTTGPGNTAVGSSSLQSNSVGINNTAVGTSALFNNTGNSNIAIGAAAGSNLNTGDNNIAIGNSGVAGESDTIRIGNAQSDTFMAGIFDKNLTSMGEKVVVVDLNGQLGTTTAPIGYTDADAIAAVGPHYTDADAIAAVGPHTTDTDTQLTEVEVDVFVANNGFSTGAHTVDTDTQLTEAQVDAFVANNNYSTGSHTIDTNTQLSEAQVDAFVANNGHHNGLQIVSGSFTTPGVFGSNGDGNVATCPAGMIAVGGGAQVTFFNRDVLVASRPYNNNAWACQARNIDSYGRRGCTSFVICASN